MVDLSTRTEVRSSFERAHNEGDVLERFYALFVSSDPEVAARFAHTDFERQKELLKTSLDVALFSAAEDDYARAELRRIRSSHGPTQLAIPARLYDLWRDCLIRAIAELDPDFEVDTERAWKATLQPAIDFLTGRSPETSS